MRYSDEHRVGPPQVTFSRRKSPSFLSTPTEAFVCSDGGDTVPYVLYDTYFLTRFLYGILLRSWIAYEDQKTQKIFWYNHTTSEGHWEKPAAVRELEHKHTSSFRVPKRAQSDMKLKRNGEWIEYVTEFGHNFYYNENSGKFQWTDPNAPDTGAGKETGGGDAPEGPWRPYKDPDSDGVFWYNHDTGVSQWDCPYPQGAGGGEDDELAIEVHDFSDLGI
jgi:hypothetical protein